MAMVMSKAFTLISAVKSLAMGPFQDELNSPTDQGSLVLLRREGVHRVDDLCPRLCPNGCLPSTNTVIYGETPRDIFQEPSP
jgi:hypothetical protein